MCIVWNLSVKITYVFFAETIRRKNYKDIRWTVNQKSHTLTKWELAKPELELLKRLNRQLNLGWLFFNQVLAVLKLKLQKPFLLKDITSCFHNISVPCTCKFTMNRNVKSKYPIKKKSTVVVNFHIRHVFQYSTVCPVKIPFWACIFHLKEDHNHVPFPHKIVESCLKVPSNLFYFSFIGSTHWLHLFLLYFLSFLRQDSSQRCGSHFLWN